MKRYVRATLGRKQIVLLSLVASLLSACASTPKISSENPGATSKSASAAPGESAQPSVEPKRGGGYYKDDGPGANPPPNLDAIPDAQPKLEPLHKFANNAYSVLGQSYVPDTSGKPYSERGLASWYGKKFHGQRTSCGEIYDMYAMTAAHPTLPIPSYARVTNVKTGKSVVVRINDRGPFHANRIIDLSYAAAHKLGLARAGSGLVQVDSIKASPLLDTPTPIAAASPPSSDASLDEQNAGKSEKTATEHYWLQFGAFSVQSNAEQLMERLKSRLGNLGDAIQVYTAEGVYRLRLGPYASKTEATERAQELKRLVDIQPLLVR